MTQQLSDAESSDVVFTVASAFSKGGCVEKGAVSLKWLQWGTSNIGCEKARTHSENQTTNHIERKKCSENDFTEKGTKVLRRGACHIRCVEVRSAFAWANSTIKKKTGLYNVLLSLLLF